MAFVHSAGLVAVYWSRFWSCAATAMSVGSAFAGSHPQDHHGFFIGFNLGAGTAQVKSGGESSDFDVMNR